MATMPDDDRVRYLEILAEYRFTGFVLWEKDSRRQLRHLVSHTERSVNQILLEYAMAGGEIRKQVEDRDPWKDTWEFHYDLLPTIDGRTIYIETRFDERNYKYPKILIVHLHPPGSHSWV